MILNGLASIAAGLDKQPYADAGTAWKRVDPRHFLHSGVRIGEVRRGCGGHDHAAACWASGAGYMSGRHIWRLIPVACSARRTYSAGSGWPFRIQLDTFCCDVPIAAANFDWFLSKGCAATALAIG